MLEYCGNCQQKYVSRRIIGVDINDAKFAKAIEMGATECVNSITCEGGDVKVGIYMKLWFLVSMN